MTQITFTIIVLVFVELVNGQDACTTAQRNLAMNIACTSAFAARSDIEAICMTCRDLFNAIISNCDGTTAADYATLISNVCDSNVECVTAQANLATNTECTSAISTGTDVVAICMTCRDLVNAIISSCDGTTAAEYATVVSNVCDSNVECITAQANLATNTECTSAFSTGTDIVAICMTCRDLFNAIISSCDGTTTAQYATLISNVCDSNVECVTAQANLATDTECTSALSTGTDTDTICVTCRDLADAIISSCDVSIADAYSNVTSTVCDSGSTNTDSGGTLQQASGIITLLIVAICALIFYNDYIA